MKSIDLPRITDCGAVHTDRGPYHYHPDTGEVYDVIGQYIGTGTMQQGILFITPQPTHHEVIT